VPCTQCREANVLLLGATAECEVGLTAVDPALLKPDQFHAYNIIVWHLDQTLAGQAPPPLHMIIHGEGSTGKSKVIQTKSRQSPSLHSVFRQAMALLSTWVEHSRQNWLILKPKLKPKSIFLV